MLCNLAAYLLASNCQLLLLTAANRELLSLTNHFCAFKVAHDGHRVHHVVPVLLFSEVAKGSQAAHTANHVLILHPLGVYGSSFCLSLFPALKHGFMLVVAHATAAGMSGVETFTVVTTGRFSKTDLLSVWIVVVRSMFALTFQVLTAKDRDVTEHFALALGRLAVHLSGLHIVEVVLFKAVPAKALRGRADCAAVLTRLHVAPVHIEAILAGFSDLLLVGFKLSLRHHFASVVVTHNLLVLNVGLDVFLGFVGKDVLLNLVFHFQNANVQVNN